MNIHVDALNRRRVLKAATASALALPFAQISAAQAKAKFVIVGGGFGGTIAARTLKLLLPDSAVTLIEPNETYTACPFSNLVISGDRELSQQLFKYDALSSLGINIVASHADRIDVARRIVTTKNGQDLNYDRLILAPGIDIRWDAIEGYNQAAAHRMPHAWKAGLQTIRLRAQLEAMEDGGLVLISSPAAPYRCPPGPYERASLIAGYLQKAKPKSKLIILDSKDNFSKKPLFLEAWRRQYPDIIEWRGASEDGRISRVDPLRNHVETDFETFQPGVANIIPPQQAGHIARVAHVADATGWCPVDPVSFESTLQSNIHVIGDACIASPMPKSAFSANLQGKICAMQISRIMQGLPPEPSILVNTCYSFTAKDRAISITGVYNNSGPTLTSVDGAGGLSTLGASNDIRQREALEAIDWFQSITGNTFS